MSESGRSGASMRWTMIGAGRGTVIAFVLLFTLAAFVSQTLSGAYHSDFSQTGDEAAHFVTALMIHDYLRTHLGTNFIHYAKDYYAHFPRVGLGHWPPMFELTQALVFFISRSGSAAIAAQALIYGLYAGLPAAVISQRYGRLLGLGAGLALFFGPVSLFLANTVMADNFLGVLVFACALFWQRLCVKTTILGCIFFALAAAAAILTKGSAIALGLLPLLDAAARRDLRLLKDWRVLLCGAAVMMITAPWYLLTYKLAAAGFNYKWGLGFTGLALARYPAMLWKGIGIPGIAGFVLGLWGLFARNVSDGARDVSAYAAAALALLIGSVAIPADIEPRYLIPALPCMMVVAVYGLAMAFEWLSSRLPALRPWKNCAAFALLLVSAAWRFAVPHIEPFGARDVAEQISAQSSPNPLVLVAGSARFEGAMIAAFALREPVPFHYVVRATKVLASGNFMGTNYAARFGQAGDLRNWIVSNQIAFVTVCADREAAIFSHNKALAELIAKNAGLFQRLGQFHFAHGQTAFYRLPAAATVPAPQNAVFKEIKFSS